MTSQGRVSTESREPQSSRRIHLHLPHTPSVDSERERSQTHQPNPFRRVLSHVRGSVVDENPLSPRRSDVSGQATAGRMLSPILSRAREAAIEHEAEIASVSDAAFSGPSARMSSVNGLSSPKSPKQGSKSITFAPGLVTTSATTPTNPDLTSPTPSSMTNGDPAGFRHSVDRASLSSAGDGLAEVSGQPQGASDSEYEVQKRMHTFKSTAQAISALTHPLNMPRYKGGEGIRRLVETREKNAKFLGLSVEYWDISLFSFRGRAWPMLPQLLYIVYSTVMVSIACTFIPNYKNVSELSGLQYLISTMGLALFLLLSFRTNSSYERWWEGRKLWDGISAKVDDIVRVALAWVAAKDRECASGMIRWSLAYAFVAKKSLRTDSTFPELAGILSQKEIDELQADIDPVTMVSDKLSAYIYQSAEGPAKVSPAIFSGVDADVKGLNMDFTSCMRILGTPMPFAYIVHLRSFIVLWLLGLPFAFLVQLGYWSIIVCTVVGYELLGFETICVEVENPFGSDFNDLPLDTITTELFVKCASALAKLGHMVDIEPIVKADPLFDKVRHAPVQYSRRGSETLPDVEDTIIPVRR